MSAKKPIFFCAVGGSGMLPLALIMKANGYEVSGSDRARDQGRTPERFAFIEAQGIKLFPQDGSGVTPETGMVVVSAAVETTVPDYQAAVAAGVPVVTRAKLLSELFNDAKTRVAVGGTSGKSTVTGMVGWILHQAGLNPTVMNGAVMKNFVTPDVPFASALVGNPDLFVTEVDESDASISLFNPDVAILNNIAVDHKTMDELRFLFTDFIRKAGRVVLNLDNTETAALAAEFPAAMTYSLENPDAALLAQNLVMQPDGVSFDVTHKPSGKTVKVDLHVPGRHNVSNALAAIGAALEAGVDLKTAAEALSDFSGIRRRMEIVGTSNGITVIDDFAHNPDKISATLRTLRQFDGRLLIMFQPHGFGPLRLMRRELAECFGEEMGEDDVLFMPDPLYFGGTTDRSVTSVDLVNDIAANGKNAISHETREGCAAAIVAIARPGDRIVIMGARDDTLPQFARDILDRLKKDKNRAGARPAF